MGLKEELSKAMKHKAVSKYAKGRMSDEIEKERERKRREGTLGSRGSTAGKDAWASLDYE